MVGVWMKQDQPGVENCMRVYHSLHFCVSLQIFSKQNIFKGIEEKKLINSVSPTQNFLLFFCF